MDKERLRVPSDSSSGSSSRGGASPSASGYRNTCTKPAYLVANSVGPPPNSPVSFSPLMPSSPHSLPPPPGLPHPTIGSIYQFPHCPAPGFQNITYPLGMSIPTANQSQVPGRYASVPGPHASQYHMNGFSVRNGILQPSNSPPPGYNYFGTPNHMSQGLPHGGALSPNHHQHSGPFNSSQHHISYSQSNDSSFDLEKRLNLLLNSTSTATYDGNVVLGNDFMSSHHPPRKDELLDVVSPSNVGNKDEKLPAKSGGVMSPIIENLVGSMSMSNGTYTHFGPSVSSTNNSMKTQNGQTDYFIDVNHTVRQNGCTDHERKSLFSQVAVSSVKETRDPDEAVVGGCNVVIKQAVIPNQMTLQVGQGQEECVDNHANANAPGTAVSHPRASSPKDPSDTSSRPQTPGKPSYLEVLTKAGIKSQPPVFPNRMTSSTSSSPVQSAFSASAENVPNLSHRKSVDYFINSTSSTPSSSCPSTSSSPATKPRNLTSGAFLKGKENFSTAATNFHAKQSAVIRSSPTYSPTHIQQQQLKSKQQGPNTERKVLASQNNSSGGKNGKVLKSGKSNEKSNVNGEDTNDDGDWGWTTCTLRGRNNNLNSVGNKNSQKRASNGHCSSEPVATNFKANDEEEETQAYNGTDDNTYERKVGSSAFVSSSSGNNGSTTAVASSHVRKPRDKEKPRSRKEDRNCVSRRLENLAYIWLTHMISALSWLWSLITDVASLSASLGASLIKDFYVWTKTKALPNFSEKISRWGKDIRQTCDECWQNIRNKTMSLFSRGETKGKRPEETGNNKPGIRHDENILSLLGPERNISLPANGDEALKRLLSVKGQDPYSILGVRSDSNEETIRRYYKRQAVLVHPDKNLIVGAEEAFKILARAFEMVGDPIKRAEYHHKLMEAQAKEKFCGEIGNLLEQLRKKMEAASSTIRCTKCNSRHKKNITDRPLFAARYCSQCRIHHGAREGELWAERGGWFGITWNYFACMDAHVWEINEWARCQKTNLKHIKADAHCVMYRLVAGGNNQQSHNQHCHGAGTSCETDDRFGAGSEADEWDSLINNLCKSPPGSTFGKTSGVPGKPGCCGSGGPNSNVSGSSGTQATGRRRKGKRNK